MAECNGPCLPHCYKCPKSTVTLSHIAIILTVALVFLLIYTAVMDDKIASVLTPTQKRFYACLKNKRMICVLIGIIVGISTLWYWQPYTEFKTI